MNPVSAYAPCPLRFRMVTVPRPFCYICPPFCCPPHPTIHRLYDYISRQFIASLSPDCKYTRTKAIFKIGDEQFQVVGRQMDQPGFIEITPWAMFSDARCVLLF